MTYFHDLSPEIDPDTTLFQFQCEECGASFAYEDYCGTPIRKICALCEFTQSHSDSEVAELKEMITAPKSHRPSDYLLVEDAVYFWTYLNSEKMGNPK